MGNTAIGSLRLRSAIASLGEHCHRELAVEVGRGTLPSRAGKAEEKEKKEAGELT